MNRGFPKKVHTKRKKYSIYNPGNENPFPQSVFYNEAVRFKIGLNSNNNFFEQWFFYENIINSFKLRKYNLVYSKSFMRCFLF